jgi:hypothetical protein
LQVVLALFPINNVNCLMATLESVFDEWEQDPILFVRAVEESADMARLIDLGTSKRNRCHYLLHSISLDGNAAIPPKQEVFGLLRLINVANDRLNVAALTRLMCRPFDNESSIVIVH